MNRLAAESTIKVPLKGSSYISINKKLLCFQSDNHIKIKSLNRQAKDIQIPFNNTPLHFSFSQIYSWLYQLTSNNLLQVYQIEYINGIADGSFKKIAILHNVEIYYENKGGLIISAKDKTLKFISFIQLAQKTIINLNIDSNTLKSITGIPNSNLIQTNYNSQKLIVTRCSKEQLDTINEPVTDIFDKIPNTNKYQKSHSLTYLNKILAIYKERYIFQRKNEKQIEIYDIEQSKLIGKFDVDGLIKFSEIRQNLLLIISNKQQIDYFHFYVLNPQPNNIQSIIINRVSYQKSKADYYKFINMKTNEAGVIIDKKKLIDFTDINILKIQDNTSTILYALNRIKQKVQIIKLDHIKLLKSTFNQQKIDKIIYSNKNIQDKLYNQSIQLEKSRINSTIEAKNNQKKKLEDLQKKFVQELIDIKLKSVIKLFQDLQHRVKNLQIQIKIINQKVQKNLEKINREEIKQNIQKIFDIMTPQFDKYFNQIFKQVAGVLDQGVTYYNLKLAKEADLHREALTQIVNETFKKSQQIVKIGQRQQKVSQMTEQHLKNILQSKKRWTASTQDFESRVRQPGPSIKSGNNNEKPQGKVFVRADLNYPNSKNNG